jgi:hypothetical protein
MVDKHLAKAIVDLAVFLEYSSEDVLNPDVAVQVLEQLAAELQLAANDAQHDLKERFLQLAPEYGERSDFVEELAGSLGIGTN